MSQTETDPMLLSLSTENVWSWQWHPIRSVKRRRQRTDIIYLRTRLLPTWRHTSYPPEDTPPVPPGTYLSTWGHASEYMSTCLLSTWGHISCVPEVMLLLNLRTHPLSPWGHASCCPKDTPSVTLSTSSLQTSDSSESPDGASLPPSLETPVEPVSHVPVRYQSYASQVPVMFHLCPSHVPFMFQSCPMSQLNQVWNAPIEPSADCCTWTEYGMLQLQCSYFCTHVGFKFSFS